MATSAAPNPEVRRLIAYCRAGFEADCAAELTEHAESAGHRADPRFQRDSGYVAIELPDSPDWRRANRSIRFDRLIFARQVVFCVNQLSSLPPTDRVSPLMAAVERLGSGFRTAWYETADTNDAKTLSRFLKGFAPKLTAALEARRLIGHASDAAPRLHFFFLDSSSVHLGLSDPGNSSPYPMGIPRLRLPGAAPSRSTLKLVEAIATLIPEEEIAAWLKPGMRAVDLGAAPGGWSMYLASRGLRVTAVDNGRLAEQVLRQGLVEHVRADGFSYRPEGPVAWMTCDMIDRPIRVAQLVADWMENGWCNRCICNLKLPMKRRLEEVRRCVGLIDARLRSAGIECTIRARHLYHDRDEVTAMVCCARSRARTPPAARRDRRR